MDEPCRMCCLQHSVLILSLEKLQNLICVLVCSAWMVLWLLVEFAIRWYEFTKCKLSNYTVAGLDW